MLDATAARAVAMLDRRTPAPGLLTHAHASSARSARARSSSTARSGRASRASLKALSGAAIGVATDMLDLAGGGAAFAPKGQGKHHRSAR
ncbi:MAG: hypothetical protein ACJ8G1_25335 [Vitreoscilla sp.]